MQMKGRTQVDSFTIGGTKAGPSMPGPRLQRMIGSRVLVNMFDHQLLVPTPQGPEVARPGDRIILYSDDSLEVEHGTDS